MIFGRGCACSGIKKIAGRQKIKFCRRHPIASCCCCGVQCIQQYSLLYSVAVQVQGQPFTHFYLSLSLSQAAVVCIAGIYIVRPACFYGGVEARRGEGNIIFSAAVSNAVLYQRQSCFALAPCAPESRIPFFFYSLLFPFLFFSFPSLTVATMPHW